MRLKDLPKKLRDRIKREHGVVVKPAKRARPKDDLPYPQFEAYCERWGLPKPKREYYFAKPRMWRFDFAFLDDMVALEVEGGAFRGDGHRNVGNFLSDIEKYNEAAILGWKLIRCTTDDLESGKAFEWLRRAMQ